MATVKVVSISASLGRSVAWVKQLGPEVSSCPVLVLHSSHEPGELSQWLCHDDSTIHFVVHYYTITNNIAASKKM